MPLEGEAKIWLAHTQGRHLWITCSAMTAHQPRQSTAHSENGLKCINLNSIQMSQCRSIPGRYDSQLQDLRWKQFSRRFCQGKACAECGKQSELTTHHLVYYRQKKAWEYSDNDLMALCWPCHMRREAVEQTLIHETLRGAASLNIDQVARVSIEIRRVLDSKKLAG